MKTFVPEYKPKHGKETIRQTLTNVCFNSPSTTGYTNFPYV